jgi:hypothetical protein
MDLTTCYYCWKLKFISMKQVTLLSDLCWFNAWFTPQFWLFKQYIPPKHRWTSSGHVAIFQKVWLSNHLWGNHKSSRNIFTCSGSANGLQLNTGADRHDPQEFCLRTPAQHFGNQPSCSLNIMQQYISMYIYTKRLSFPRSKPWRVVSCIDSQLTVGSEVVSLMHRPRSTTNKHFLFCF